MNAKSWIFSLVTALVLTFAALVHTFLLMWGMEHYKTSVKPYAYALFAALSLIIIVVAAMFAGPFASWAARKSFPNSDGAGILISLITCFLAIVVGIAALFVTMPGVLAIFDDPLPQLSTSMSVKFPAQTRVVYSLSSGGEIWDDKLIVRLYEAGWEEFRRNQRFQPEGLKISAAREDENLREWRTFENAEAEAQVYRWMRDKFEPRILKVLARRADRGQIYVYLYLTRNVKF